jgi:hypothetical protein
MASSFPVRVPGIIPAGQCLIPATMLMHFCPAMISLDKMQLKSLRRIEHFQFRAS